jgi:hypothetical protein
MIRITTIFTMFFLFTISHVSGQHKFAWLTGTWKLKGEEVYEVWKEGADGTLFAKSYKVTGKDTLLLEKVSLTYSGGSYHYVPDVAENKSPVDFKITAYDDKSFVAENPKHDFPKLIRYTIVRKDDAVWIEAAIEGNGKVIPYTFEKIR